MSGPLISVLVPARDETTDLEVCLASLQAQTVSSDMFEVLVADASSSGIDQRIPAQASPGIRVISNPDVIMSRGLNRAAGEARGKYLAIVSAHSRLPEDYLERVLEVSRRTGAANVGGRVAKVARTPWGRAVAAATTSPFAVGDAGQHYSGQSGPADSVFPGFIDRAAFDKVGGFNTALACNEDDEFNARLRAAGYLVWYDASISVDYRPRETIPGLWRQQFRYGRWKLAVSRSGVRGYLRPRHLVPALTVIGLAASACAAAIRPVLALPGAMLGAIYAGLMLTEASRMSRGGQASRWRIAVLFPVIHAAYGLGFLRGLLDRGYPVEGSD